MDYEALRDYLNEHDPYSRMSHISIVKLEPGKSEVTLTVCPDNENFMGFLHGGAYYTLADVAGGSALVQRNSKCVTLQADLHFLRKAHGRGDHCLWHMRASWQIHRRKPRGNER